MAEKVEINLWEITGQKTGIIVRGDEVLAVNWAGQIGNPSLPPWPSMDLDYGPFPDVVEDMGEVEDVRTLLPGSDIVIDPIEHMNIRLYTLFAFLALYGTEISFNGCSNQDLIRRDENDELLPTRGKVYRVGSAIVIAPYGWK